MPKKPVDHYADIPADEGEDYEGPEADLSDPRQNFDDSTLAASAGAAANLSKGYQKQKKGSRSEAADRMMEE